MDRNRDGAADTSVTARSLSARRAWIEIIDYIIDYATDAVALRKESVDRNTFSIVTPPAASLSARRAWIEISPLMWPWSPLNSRSPQGERG